MRGLEMAEPMANNKPSFKKTAKGLGHLVAGFTITGIFKNLGHKEKKQEVMVSALASRAIRKLHREVRRALVRHGADANPVVVQEVFQQKMMAAMINGGLPKKLARKIVFSNMERLGGIAFSLAR
ncbi:hypothetical protein MAPG_05326 [Magnaporthiopsis poae ATCC 64411]|uniref:Uncharacterized protein n=1 Tax=Magnaporthiopsis poae (strain ATCC 64411 / 73-15) TaxID=644358 RepID=A0A0C4CSE9_MAGP6|nr:hypothetical protein, variant [Magnaporthiopsis poae ATCC 64411]KLU86312.1 hypothetical protein MAPG_05326 [Magnaporthiopsis poae ATCC 64411]